MRCRAKKIKLLLVDDHPIVREGIKSSLSTHRHIRIAFLTEGAQPNGERAGGEPGPIEYSHKPSTRDQRSMTVQKNLSRKRQKPQ